MKRLFLMMALMAVSCVSFQAQAADSFPEKPITYTIPFGPGGESDITARLQKQHLETLLGVPVNIVYQPGAGGSVGWSAFQHSAKPTGYELIGTNLPHIVSQPMIREDAGFTADGFEHVIWFHFTPNVLIVPKSSPIKTVAGFIAAAKDKPGSITIGGSGNLSANHLDVLRLQEITDTKMTYIPYKGTGALKPDFLAGHMSAMMSSTMLSIELQDQIRVLAITAEARHPYLPNVPTFKELGYDIVGGTSRGVAAPKGTPKEVINILAKAFAETNLLIKDKQIPQGFYQTTYTGEAAKDLVNQVNDNYMTILQEIVNK